jgi:type I restriction enzyme S subunit
VKQQWTEVALGEVLEPVSRSVRVEPHESYRLLGVRLEGNGAYHRETKLGGETSASVLDRVRNGDFIYSRLFAWRGAFSLIGPELDGAFVSNEFPMFAARKPERIDLRYLKYWFRQSRIWKIVEEDCQGSTPLTRNRYKEEFFSLLRIPLPPLAEQQRLIAHLHAVETRLTHAQKLRDESALESRALLRSLIDTKHCGGVKPVPMHELVTWRSPDIAVSQSESYTFAGVYSFGRGVFRKEALSGMDFAYDRLTRLRAGEFTYPKLMAWEGALGVVPIDCDGCHVSPEFPVFTADEDKVLPEILDIHFKTPAVWKELAAISTGTNVRRRRLNPHAFLGYQFPLPPMEAQWRVKAIANRAATKRKLQHAAATLENAILPSLLDHVFRS